ncbi:DNA-primase RepB domain-containing protein [Dyella jiangningensis]|uniref:DNA-primase RepB domain-containing protein n=1 Tax=Dyella jiangningensis TaxID=1379159 RepID=UPI00155992F7|nr:DNA-primase RepB domain-containing protein [Dyella jiangningensis]
MSNRIASLPAANDAWDFLDALGGRDSVFTFQTFDDSKPARPRLAQIMHGKLSQKMASLSGLNARGAGIFVMVNAGDLRGRATRNVTAVRAYFADLDGVDKSALSRFTLKPHMVIESSRGSFHAYWLVHDAPLDVGTFKSIQQGLASLIGSDPKVCDLPRVMRVPGFIHRKGDPIPSRIIELNQLPKYAHAEVAGALGLIGAANDELGDVPPKVERLPGRISLGHRNEVLFAAACGFVRKGILGDTLRSRLQTLNQDRCEVPLSDPEVAAIAESAASYGSDGYSAIPHRVFDSAAFVELEVPAKLIVLTAYRRYNGQNNGDITLSFNDFKGQPGFSSENTFYKHRRSAIEAGLLVETEQGGMTQQGKKAAKFAIPPEGLAFGEKRAASRLPQILGLAHTPNSLGSIEINSPEPSEAHTSTVAPIRKTGTDHG